MILLDKPRKAGSGLWAGRKAASEKRVCVPMEMGARLFRD